MAIEFFCTQCGNPLRASDGSTGQRVLCAACGRFSIVPESPMPEPLPGGAPQPAKLMGMDEPPAPSSEGDNPYRSPNGTARTTYPSPGNSNDTRAVLSLVFGCVGLGANFFCCGLGLPFAIAGLVLGILAIKANPDNRGVAIAGIVVSSITLVLLVIFLGFLAFVIAAKPQ